MRRALEMMWASYRAGSYPVGAVLTDASGAVVLEGRNHAGEPTAGEGLMRGTPIAHAEMSVLAQLPAGDYDEWTLWTTLQPCVLCQAAAMMSHVGHVAFLAADAICNGLDQLPRINAHAERRYPTMAGPSTSVEARFAAILPLAVLLAASPRGWAVTQYRRFTPDEAATAEHIVAGGRWPSRDLDLDEAMSAVAALP